MVLCLLHSLLCVAEPKFPTNYDDFMILLFTNFSIFLADEIFLFNK